MANNIFTLNDYLPEKTRWSAAETERLLGLICPLKFRIVIKSSSHKQVVGSIISLVNGHVNPIIEVVPAEDEDTLKIHVRDNRNNVKFTVRPWEIEPVSFTRPFIAYAIQNLNDYATLMLSQANGLNSLIERANPEGDAPFDIIDVALIDALKRFDGKKGATTKEKINILRQIVIDASSFSVAIPEGSEDGPAPAAAPLTGEVRVINVAEQTVPAEEEPVPPWDDDDEEEG